MNTKPFYFVKVFFTFIFRNDFHLSATLSIPFEPVSEGVGFWVYDASSTELTWEPHRL